MSEIDKNQGLSDENDESTNWIEQEEKSSRADFQEPTWIRIRVNRESEVSVVTRVDRTRSLYYGIMLVVEAFRSKLETFVWLTKYIHTYST